MRGPPLRTLAEVKQALHTAALEAMAEPADDAMARAVCLGSAAALHAIAARIVETPEPLANPSAERCPLADIPGCKPCTDHSMAGCGGVVPVFVVRRRRRR